MSPEIQVATFAAIILGLVGCWFLFRWFVNGPRTPDPWDQKTEESLHQPDAMPLCSRCLEAHDAEARFCHNCGVPVDPLVAFSPYLYIFAFGDMLRAGVSRRFRINWVTVTGFLLLPLAFLPFLLAFVYWFIFLRNLNHRPEALAQPDPGTIPPSPGNPS